MTTKEDVESAFRADLQALLDKYEATMEAHDYWLGYASGGAHIRITAYVKDAEINLGNYLKAKVVGND